MKIKISLDKASVNKAIQQVREFKERLHRKNEIFAHRLAEMGARDINTQLQAISGMIPHDEPIGTAYIENTNLYSAVRLKIVVASSMILFVEFGTGIKYAGTQNPKAGELGMGPGTYPGKGHWDDPNGWSYQDASGVWHHTYGIRAQMPMYNASQKMIGQVLGLAKEVFHD